MVTKISNIKVLESQKSKGSKPTNQRERREREKEWVRRREKRKVRRGKRRPPKKAGANRHKKRGRGREKRNISPPSPQRKALFPSKSGKTPLGEKGKGTIPSKRPVEALKR